MPALSWAGDEAANSEDPVAALVGQAMTNHRAYERLQYLTDYVGPRLAGSENLDKAIDWAYEELKKDGLEVRREKVMVPHWVRGEESLTLTAPVERELRVLGIGNSVGTPRRGLTGEVVSVRSFDELEALGSKVKGKIVLFNVVMDPHIEAFDAYDAVFEYRSHGATKAGEQGAIAVLVRSLTTRSLSTLHTGGLRYSDDGPKIPAATVTTEDADLLQRFLDRGEKVRVKLKMGAKMLPDAESANVVADIRGSEKPDEIVIVCAHIDAWDVGTGAWDDGAGVTITMEVASLLRELDLKPKRTIRIVLFTNEENGLRGAFAYARAHGKEKHVAGLESDSGAGRPLGYWVEGSPEAVKAVEQLVEPLKPLGAARIRAGFSGVDLIPLTQAGMPGLGLDPVATHYFDLHHTDADTFDKVEPLNMSLQAASYAVMAWQLANADELLPRTPPKEEGTH